MSAYTTLRITREDAIFSIIQKLQTADNEQLEDICEKLEIGGSLYNYLITSEYRPGERNFREI
jgi:hypothetical protein